MFSLGIRVPLRMPLWENNNAYADLGDRHSRCDARECLCPQGREHREERGPWQLLLCRSCAAEGTHRGCCGLRTSGALWECDSCAGLGTASSASSELAGPSTASQAAPGPSLGSPAPETGSLSTTSQAGPGPSHSSLALETSSPSTGSQEASGLSSGAPALETSGPSPDSQAASEPTDGSLGLDTGSPSTAIQAALSRPPSATAVCFGPRWPCRQ
ncbi:PHD finger protein 7, partial [Columba livia]